MQFRIRMRYNLFPTGKDAVETTQVRSWTVDINDGQKKLLVKNGLSLLAVLGRNNIVLPSACGGNARCGYCKVKFLMATAW